MTTTCPEWKQKAEDFLRPYADPNSEALHEEAVVYFLSRGVNCEDAVKKIILKWKDIIQKNDDLLDVKLFSLEYPITIWRIVEWGQIWQFREYWETVPIKYQNRYNMKGIMISLSEFNFLCPFFYFWADIGIQRLNKKLKSILFNCGEILDNGFVTYYDRSSGYAINLNPPVGQRVCMIAASYIFGQYRMQSNMKDEGTFSSATHKLVEEQAPNGSWWEDNKSADNVILTASAIHALALSRPLGTERAVKCAKDFLLKMQNPDGSWPYPHLFDPIYSTVFVLDALELASGRTQVTFKISAPEKQKNELTDKNISTGSPIIHVTPEKLEINIINPSSNNVPVSLLNSKTDTINNPAAPLSETQEKLFDDPINQEIILIYQAVEQVQSGNSHLKDEIFKKPPSYNQIADYLHKKGLTENNKKKLSRQSIAKRVKKLKSAGLIGFDVDFHEKALQHNPHDLNDMSDKIKEIY